MIAWLFKFQDCCEQFDNPTGGLKLASVGPFTPQELANVAEKKNGLSSVPWAKGHCDAYTSSQLCDVSLNHQHPLSIVVPALQSHAKEDRCGYT